MKKLALLVTALLAISGTALAADVDGVIVTKVETGNRTDALWSLPTGWYTVDNNFTNWVTDGFLKGSNWGDFQLGFTFNKTHNDGEDNDGAQEFEFRPGYNHKTSWGEFGGQVIFEQGRVSGAATGYDNIKPEVWATYNINDKSRVWGRMLYMKGENTVLKATDIGTDNHAEGEVQYKYDIGGGTAMAGVFYVPGVDSIDGKETRILGSFSKWWPQYKVFTSLYGDVRDIERNDGLDIYAYKASLYANTPMPFMDGLVLEGEINRYADIKTPDAWNKSREYAENFFMLGMRYNF